MSRLKGLILEWRVSRRSEGEWLHRVWPRSFNALCIQLGVAAKREKISLILRQNRTSAGVPQLKHTKYISETRSQSEGRCCTWLIWLGSFSTWYGQLYQKLSKCLIVPLPSEACRSGLLGTTQVTMRWTPKPTPTPNSMWSLHDTNKKVILKYLSIEIKKMLTYVETTGGSKTLSALK